MSIFDQMKNKAQSQFKTAVRSSMQNMGNQKEAFTFVALPESVAQMRTLPEAAMDTPFKTAALTVCALCAFAADQSIGTEMLNFLRGPRPLNGQDISFIKDRFRGGARSYIIFSYFTGATPENNYTPTKPYTVTISSDSHSYDEENYARLYVACGADSPRPVKLRKKADGQWCLWEQYLLTDIRQPKANDPWA